MGTRLFIAGLAWRTTEERIARHMASVGDVIDLRLVTDRETGRSKGYAFAEMATAAQAERAVRELTGSDLDGRAISVQEARPKPAMSEPHASPRGSSRPSHQDGGRRC